MCVAVYVWPVLMSMLLAIVVSLLSVFMFVFVFVRHWVLSLFGLVLRQASAETPVPSRHQHSLVNFTRKLRRVLIN